MSSKTKSRAKTATKPRLIDRRDWTTADVKTMKSLAKQRVSARDIAGQLQRTESAVRQKAYAIGLSLSLRRGKAKRKKAA